jgi:predicted Zn-dependent peptidase
VAAAGRVDHERLVAEVSRAFAAIPARPAPKPGGASYRGGRQGDYKRSAAEVQLLVGYEGRAVTHPDAVAANLAAMVVGGGTSSRLFQSLREDAGHVYETSAFHWAFSDTGLLGIHLATEPGRVLPALGLATDELAAAMEGMSDDEVRRAKAVWRAGILMSRESCGARAEQAARSAIVFGRPRTKEERIAEVEAATTADVKRVLAEMLASPPTIVHVGGARPERLDRAAHRLATLAGSGAGWNAA